MAFGFSAAITAQVIIPTIVDITLASVIPISCMVVGIAKRLPAKPKQPQNQQVMQRQKAVKQHLPQQAKQLLLL